ncbi:MAG TPA: LLM class flavin-dependent oxidoreductase [Acidimicrobiales bacterium]
MTGIGTTTGAAATRPKLGIVLFGGTVDDLLDLTRSADAAGFDSVWTTDFYTRSATVSLAAMAMVSARITVGSAIAYGVGRSPFVLATEARDIHELAAGRLILGLGTGTRRMQQAWHGVDPSGSAARMTELVPLLRRFWRLDVDGIHHDGRYFRVHLEPTGNLPPACEIPVYLAGVNRLMLAAAGAVADGQIGHPLFTRRYVEEVVVPTIAEAAEAHGRRPADVERAGYVICSVADDEALAVREAKRQIAFYALVKTYDPILAMHGLESVGDDIRSAWAGRDAEAMADAVPDRMVELMAVAGRPDTVVGQFEERFGGVHDHVLLYPPSFGVAPGRFSENLAAIVETFAPVEVAR